MGSFTLHATLASEQLEGKAIVSSHHYVYEGNKSWELEVASQILELKYNLIQK
jgi:hypothetical protein